MSTDLARKLPLGGYAARPGRIGALVAIVLAHALLLWGLARALDWPPALDVDPAPLLVQLLHPQRQPAPPEVTLPLPATARLPVPTAPPLPLPAPVETTTPEPAASLLLARPAAEAPAAAPPAAPPSAPTAPAAPPVERQIAVTQVEYLTPPVLTYPLASRRLREQGQAQVRVRVDEHGRPDRVLLLRSSGSERLDEAALTTVRATRFKPYTEDGAARPFWVVMPLIFELDT
jgi:periplasmic protein TonB